MAAAARAAMARGPCCETTEREKEGICNFEEAGPFLFCFFDGPCLDVDFLFARPELDLVTSESLLASGVPDPYDPDAVVSLSSFAFGAVRKSRS